MTQRLLWKLLFNVISVIILTILVVWLAIDKLAATYFMRLMENYSIAPHDSHQMFIQAVHHYLIWAALAALGFALLLSYLMTRRVLRPLTQMTRISQELSQGIYSNRVEVVSNDEVGQLGSAFNLMADNLEKLEGLRKRMVADIAHELRTPLTNLRGYFEGLGDAIIPPSQATFKMLETETLRLVDLVETLQQLSKAEAAEAFLQRQDINLSLFFDQLLMLFALRFQGKQIDITVTVEPKDLVIVADQDKLLQVFRNLLENALGHTPDHGWIRIAAQRTPERIDIQVTNSGSSIATEDLPFIFERFFRADPSRSRQQGGAGIGLAIVKQVIEAHGGRVAAKSQEGWTCFTVTLPIQNSK
jgi:signal transduction histidine kinase